VKALPWEQNVALAAVWARAPPLEQVEPLVVVEPVEPEHRSRTWQQEILVGQQCQQADAAPESAPMWCSWRLA
jgi:hypothetical protein